MRRAIFLSGSLAALTTPVPANARTLDVDDVIAAIPGITGVFARTLAPGPPRLAIRADEPFASASIIKLWIMATVYRAYDAGTAAPHDEIRVRADDLIGGSPTLAGARPGQAFTLATLVRAMVQQSDNSASNALITAFSFAAINATAQRFGMHGTHLARHFADVVPARRRSLNVTTPHDVGSLLTGIERGSREGLDTIARSASCRAMIEVLLGQEDKSKIPSGLPPGTPCADKTGEIDGVRNDGAIVDPFGDTPYVLVVLTRELRDTSAGNRGIGAIARRINATLTA